MTFLKKILLVDYDARAIDLVRAALEKTGRYQIKEEHDSRHALKSARWFRPDLILFDIAMTRPEANKVARELQQDPEFRETPVVFVSVNTSGAEGIASAGILSGYSFMANPVRIDELVRYVSELLDLPAQLAKAARQMTRD
ncbi:MAG TPA: response regulator [Chthoniobacterales bacterium]